MAALDHQVLLGSAIFVTRSGAKITIGEILFDPGKYEGEVGPDPIEGRSYGSTTARVMAARAGGAPVIFSFAHGDMIYELKHDVGSIETGSRVPSVRRTTPPNAVSSLPWATPRSPRSSAPAY